MQGLGQDMIGPANLVDSVRTAVVSRMSRPGRKQDWMSSPSNYGRRRSTNLINNYGTYAPQGRLHCRMTKSKTLAYIKIIRPHNHVMSSALLSPPPLAHAPPNFFLFEHNSVLISLIVATFSTYHNTLRQSNSTVIPSGRPPNSPQKQVIKTVS